MRDGGLRLRWRLLRLLDLEHEGRDPQAQVEEEVHLPRKRHPRSAAQARGGAKARFGANSGNGQGG